ncbi:PH domain-containing protein [Pelomonas sp. V22]|uniref:PH domain-containing protein n=1 Tax=Pelomonas sp. V22 TaxID=2822139 RepID=UPI0024A9AB15|nr:PH domain-containing protein [Pelomonas sp. V22]MDI4632877.1 PH domain-containing protein [Pelomonas sp. V22]
MTQATDPLQARFNTLIRPYLVIYVGSIMMITLILLPLAVLWFCGLGQWWARHYYDKLECELGATALRFRKGILFQVEKTIPLENIQDITFIEGPLLKQFHLSILKFETAGQAAGQAHDMRLIGVIDAHELRAQILSRREALKNSRSRETPAANATDDEMRQLLRAILGRLDEIAAQGRQAS